MRYLGTGVYKKSFYYIKIPNIIKRLSIKWIQLYYEVYRRIFNDKKCTRKTTKKFFYGENV